MNHRFGRDVAIIEGDTVAVGAPGHDNFKGTVYIFDGSGKEMCKVVDPDGDEADHFGGYMYASNKFIAVRTLDYMFICDKAGKILAKRRAPGDVWTGDVALRDDKLVVHDNNDGVVILMQYQIAKVSFIFIVES